MKEIGGYFQLEELCGTEYYPDLIHLNLGRTALLYILKVLNVKKLTVPYFLCSSVIDICKKAGITLSYYHIDKDFMPILPEQTGQDTYIYIVNYYGQISNESLEHLSYQYQNRIIADYTHSFFQPPVSGIPTLYSIRKFFGLPDGAYVSMISPIKESDLPMDYSSSRMEHILGRYEHSASIFYQNMLNTAHSFDTEDIKQMSPLTRNLLKGIPYESVKTTRTENYGYLHQKLSAVNPLHLITPAGAFTYPFYYQNAPALKKALAARKIFVPTYWNNVIETMEEHTIEHDYARNILPLPCDQRYSVSDMDTIIQAVLEEIGRLENKI